MEFQDRSLECIDCHAPFIFTAGEQEFYDRKGFKEIPKRCKTCRDNLTRANPRAAALAGSGDGLCVLLANLFAAVVLPILDQLIVVA